MGEWKNCRDKVLSYMVDREESYISDFAKSAPDSFSEDAERDALKIVLAGIVIDSFQMIKETDPNFPEETLRALLQNPAALDNITENLSASYDAMRAFDGLKAGAYSYISEEASWTARISDLENSSSDER